MFDEGTGDDDRGDRNHRNRRGDGDGRGDLRDGQTAHEYSQNLGQTLRQRGQHSRLPRSREAAAKAPGQVESLSDTFVRAQYSPGPIDLREGYQVRELWPRLRRHLVWLWVSIGRRTGRESDPLE